MQCKILDAYNASPTENNKDGLIMEYFIKLIKNNDLFKCFSYDELMELFTSNYYKIKKYEKSSIIYLQNEKCENLDFILEGSVTIQKIDSEGNILTINDFMKGDVLGENLLFSSNNNFPMTVTAKSNTTILHIKKELVLKLCQNNERFLINFLQSLSNKTLILSNKIKSLTFKTIRQCIIEFLLYEYYSQGTTEIKLNMSKKDLAEKIGVQRSSFSRELNKMRKDGLIDFNNKYIFIKDIEKFKILNIDM